VTADGDKNLAAQLLARARRDSLTPERRSEIAKLASAARWEKYRAEKKALDKSKRKHKLEGVNDTALSPKES